MRINQFGDGGKRQGAGGQGAGEGQGRQGRQGRQGGQGGELKLPHSKKPTPHSGRSIWIVKFWLNNKSYRPNASPLQQIVPTPHSKKPTPKNPLPIPHIWRLCLICCCLLFIGGCQPTNVSPGTLVQVQRVVSGQTMEVLNPNQRPALITRVRLIGIEAPDIKQQPWGEAAKNIIEETIGEVRGEKLVLKPVFLEFDVQRKDSFGRWLAYIWYNGVLLNEKLVKEGYVLAAVREPNHKYSDRLIQAQEYARIMGYGIWNPEKPLRLTPAEFRRQNP